MLPNGLVMLLAASFQSLPVGSSPGNSELPPNQLACRWRRYVPSKCTLDPGGRVGAARGEGRRFAHSLHTAARLPGQLYHLSEAEPPSKATFPQCFQLGWGLPVLRVEGQRQNTHIGPCLGVHIIEERGQHPSEWTGWISLQSKGLSRVFFNTTVQKHQFFGAQEDKTLLLLAFFPQLFAIK